MNVGPGMTDMFTVGIACLGLAFLLPVAYFAVKGIASILRGRKRFSELSPEDQAKTRAIANEIMRENSDD